MNKNRKITAEQIDENKLNGMESMVFCKDGHCRTVSPEEFLANTGQSAVARAFVSRRRALIFIAFFVCSFKRGINCRRKFRQI